jgi:hypothetical protein
VYGPRLSGLGQPLIFDESTSVGQAAITALPQTESVVADVPTRTTSVAQKSRYQEEPKEAERLASEALSLDSGDCGQDVDSAMSEACRGKLKTTVETISGEADLLGDKPGVFRPLPPGILLEIQGFNLLPTESALPVVMQRLSKAKTEYVAR